MARRKDLLGGEFIGCAGCKYIDLSGQEEPCETCDINSFIMNIYPNKYERAESRIDVLPRTGHINIYDRCKPINDYREIDTNIGIVRISAPTPPQKDNNAETK